MDVKVVDVSEEEVYAGFDAIGVPRTTDGTFKDGSPAPYSSDGMELLQERSELVKWIILLMILKN